eukprot:gene22430-biopygen1169
MCLKQHGQRERNGSGRGPDAGSSSPNRGSAEKGRAVLGGGSFFCLKRFGGFPPVLLSAGGGVGAKLGGRAQIHGGRVLFGADRVRFGASVGRPRAGGWRRGGPSFSRIPPWHAYMARFSRVRAAMRTAPGARKVGPDDTDELRERVTVLFDAYTPAGRGLPRGMACRLLIQPVQPICGRKGDLVARVAAHVAATHGGGIWA